MPRVKSRIAGQTPRLIPPQEPCVCLQYSYPDVSHVQLHRRPLTSSACARSKKTRDPATLGLHGRRADRPQS
jgi:hypothetical protein